MSEQLVGRVIYFNFRKPKDCQLWLSNNEKDGKEIEKGALQRTILQLDETSLAIFTLFKTEADAEIVFKRFRRWTRSFMSEDDYETFTIVGTVAYNVINDDKN